VGWTAHDETRSGLIAMKTSFRDSLGRVSPAALR